MKSPISSVQDLRGLKVTEMGLGLNGGGLASARFLAERGALVTVTDMKDEAALAAPLGALAGLPIRFVLGRHDLEDFRSADLVLKNPAVRPDSPYLQATRAVETDLSLFLRLSRARIIAVTGSKALISADDGNGNVFWTRDTEFTDCPEGEWKFFLVNNTFHVPSEY